jgi:hypothetical protein
MLVAILGTCAPVGADVTVRVRESSFSIGRTPPRSESVVETSIKAGMRRVETLTQGAPGDTTGRPVHSVQLDRIDRDSSYYFRPGDSLYLPVALSVVRESNRRSAGAFVRARSDGSAPRDTLAAVRTIELGQTRTILGTNCKGVVLEMVFSYRDSAMTNGEELTGVLTDTVWLAPPSSAPGQVRRFEQDFARATAADSFLAAANAVQLAQARGQGLVSVLQRAVRGLPGYPIESTFVNVLHGLPRGLELGEGVERRPDGAVIVQRTIRRALSISDAPLGAERFEVPRGSAPVAARRP